MYTTNCPHPAPATNSWHRDDRLGVAVRICHSITVRRQPSFNSDIETCTSWWVRQHPAMVQRRSESITECVTLCTRECGTIRCRYQRRTCVINDLGYRRVSDTLKRNAAAPGRQREKRELVAARKVGAAISAATQSRREAAEPSSRQGVARDCQPRVAQYRVDGRVAHGYGVSAPHRRDYSWQRITVVRCEQLIHFSLLRSSQPLVRFAALTTCPAWAVQLRHSSNHRHLRHNRHAQLPSGSEDLVAYSTVKVSETVLTTEDFHGTVSHSR